METGPFYWMAWSATTMMTTTPYPVSQEIPHRSSIVGTAARFIRSGLNAAMAAAARLLWFRSMSYGRNRVAEDG